MSTKNIITEPYQFIGFINQSKNEKLVKIKKEICQKYKGDFISVTGSRIDDDSKTIRIRVIKNLPEKPDPYKEQREKLFNAGYGEDNRQAIRAYLDFEEKYPEPFSFECVHDFPSFTLSSSGICGIYLKPMNEGEAIDLFIDLISL